MTSNTNHQNTTNRAVFGSQALLQYCQLSDSNSRDISRDDNCALLGYYAASGGNSSPLR
jgi:hypothetical protein